MLSEESLEYIEKVMIAKNGRLSLYEKLNIKTISKDLKILEILKRYFKYDGNNYIIEHTFWKANENFGKGWEEHNKEYQAIKEWLNNGN